VRLSYGAERIRQIHAAQHARRARPAHERPGHHQWQDMATLRDVDSFRAKTVGFVFQLHNLIPTLSSLENIEVPMQGQGLGICIQHIV
jgi:ABC-type polar amino acid transport system ATPase subunit